jgi:PPOX class probable F420-dependent enzyme
MSSALIPGSYLDLITRAGVATLSTLSADRSIQSSLVWFDYCNEVFTINVVDSSAKAKNLERHPQATLLIMDSGNVDRYLSVRCEVNQFQKDGAIAHLNKLTQRNTDHGCWYGGAVQENRQEAAHRVIVGLKPVRVYCAE